MIGNQFKKCQPVYRNVRGILILWLGCSSVTGQELESKVPANYSVTTTMHSGICDASGVVAIDSKTFAAVGDERNLILVYQVGRPGLPVSSTDVSAFLDVDKEEPEVDFEGGARIGDIVYWISSHGRSRTGKKRDSRHRFFATRISQSGDHFQIIPHGMAYQRLLADLIEDERYAAFGLEAASKLAPKDRGALNIEGLTETPEGHLLIGFRNPLPQGKALIAPLTNPSAVINGQRAVFDAPILLDLQGNGIRGMASSKNSFLILGGPFGAEGKTFLYQWKRAESNVSRAKGVEFDDLNPEGVTYLPSQPPSILLLSDDGTRDIGGIDCKQLQDFTQKRFRSVVIAPRP